MTNHSKKDKSESTWFPKALTAAKQFVVHALGMLMFLPLPSLVQIWIPQAN